MDELHYIHDKILEYWKFIKNHQPTSEKDWEELLSDADDIVDATDQAHKEFMSDLIMAYVKLRGGC